MSKRGRFIFAGSVLVAGFYALAVIVSYFFPDPGLTRAETMWSAALGVTVGLLIVGATLLIAPMVFDWIDRGRDE